MEKRILSKTLDINSLINQCTINRLEPVKIIALVVKREWALFLSSKKISPDKHPLNNPETMLLKYEFDPDCEMIFKQLESQNHLLSKDGFTQKKLSGLVREMIVADMHLAAIDSPEMNAFCKRQNSESKCMTIATPEQEEQFNEAKFEWLQQHEELGECLLFLERRRLKNANIQREWMEIFGDLFIALKEQTFRYEGLQLRLELLRGDPGLSEKALNEIVKSVEQQMKSDLKRLRLEMAVARFCHQKESKGPFDDEHFTEYVRKCKKILRQIWLLLHPDRLTHHKNYKNLTSDQKLRLERYWRDAMKVRPMELGYQEGQIGYEYRSLEVLMGINESAGLILENAGIDTDTRLIIQGKGVAEKLAWINSANEILAREIEYVQAKLKILLEDQDMRGKRCLLDSEPDKIEAIRTEMKINTREYRQKADKLESQVKLMLLKN